MFCEDRSWLVELALTIAAGLAAAWLGLALGGTRGLMLGASSLLLALPLFTWGFLALPSGDSPLRAWLARAFAAPFVALMAWWIIEHPVVHYQHCWICGDHESDLVIAALAVVFAAALVALSTAMVATRLTLRVTNAGARVRVLRKGALAALLTGALAMVASISASVRKPAPTVADWSRSLPTAGTLRAGGESAVAIGSVTVSHAHERIIRVRHPNGTTDVHTPLIAPITVRRDAARALIVLEEAYAGDVRCTSRFPCRVVVREDGTRVALYARDLAEITPPPMVWIVSGALGLLVATLTLFARKSPIEALRGHTFRDATHEGLGVVRLPEGSRALSDAVLLDTGPVVVVERDIHSAYRGAHDVVTVVAGTAAELVDAIHNAEGARSARTIAIALVVTAPVVATCFCGFAP